MKLFIFSIAFFFSSVINHSNAQVKKPSFCIVLLGGFDNDRVKLLVDDKKIFDKIITSDLSTDLAGSCSFKKGSQKQKVVTIINGHQMRTIYLNHLKIHNQVLGIWKYDNFIYTTFYNAPLRLE